MKRSDSVGFRLSSARPRAVILGIVAAIALCPSFASAVIPPPQTMEVVSASETIELIWDAVEDPSVAGYLVYYDADGPEAPYDGTGALEGDSPIRIEGSDAHSLVLHGLQEETLYHFVVAAYDTEDLPGSLTPAAPGVLCDILDPAAPVGLSASLQDDGVRLSWTVNTEVDFYGTSIFRGLDPAPSDSLGFVLAPSGEFLDTAPGYGQTVYYTLRAADFCGLRSPVSEVVSVDLPNAGAAFTRSDVDASGELNISDPIFNLEYQFEGGPAPTCLRTADDDDNGEINVGDPIYSLEYQFAQGPPPPAPFPSCGADFTIDQLSCGGFVPCETPLVPADPVPSEGAEVLAFVQQEPVDGMLSCTVALQSGVPLVGIEGRLAYDPEVLEFTGLDRTGSSEGWDFLSARAYPGDGVVRMGAVPDLELREPVMPQGEVVAVLRFRIREGSGEIALTPAGGRFVGQGSVAILPALDEQGTSGLDNAGSSVAPKARPEVIASNPYRTSAEIRLGGLVGGAPVRAALYSVTGELVRTLYDGAAPASDIRVVWDGRRTGGLAAGAGVYYLRMQSGDSEVSRKLLYLP